MKGFFVNIEEETLKNENFRKVLYTGKESQLVLMSLPVGEDIGLEIHDENDQFFRFEKGEGICVIDENEYEVSDGTGIIVPKGAQHNVINTSKTESLKMYTIYSPPHHKDATIHVTKKIAETAEEKGDEEFDGLTTE